MLIEFINIVFIFIVSIQLFYYLVIFSRFVFANSSNLAPNNLPVSVIICAKNEADNLEINLPIIFNQNYKNFEVILVNDHSIDKTFVVMNALKAKFVKNDIKIINLNKTQANKKKAITKAIQASKYDYLLFIDADCKPNSKNWILEMQSNFNTKKSIILGYGAYQKNKNSWLNKLIRFETLLTAIQYFSYAKIGLPYMGVGRNIAYTKLNFNLANGFVKHKNIKSGDDDLFVNQIATKQNTAICFTKNSFTTSKPHINFKKWVLQKRRHISTVKYYKPIHKIMLGLFYISQFLFWSLAILLIFINYNTNFIFLLIFIRISFQYCIFGFSAKKLNEKDLIWFFPILELFLIIIQMSIFLRNLISKPTHW